MKKKCIGCIFFAAAFIDLGLIKIFNISITGILWSPFIFFCFGMIFIYNNLNSGKNPYNIELADLEELIVMYTRKIQNDPFDAGLYYMRGSRYYQLNIYDKAYYDLKRAGNLDKEYMPKVRTLLKESREKMKKPVS